MKKIPTPEPAPLSDASHDDLYWEAFWFHHKTKLLALLGILLLAGLGTFGWMAITTASTRAAADKLAVATDLPAFEAVAKEYPRTQAGADALLRIAALQRDAGRLQESTAAFQQFIDTFPKHSLIGGAWLGIGQNAAAGGDPKLAMTTFTELASKYPSSYAAPFALYAAAEIHLRNFERSEAQALFQKITTAHSSSYVARLATMQLSALGSEDVLATPQ